MSEENAETIRRAYEVWNESGPAAVTEQFWAEDAVYREGPGWPNAGVYRGRAAALERMEALVDLFGPIEVRLDTDETALSGHPHIERGPRCRPHRPVGDLPDAVGRLAETVHRGPDVQRGKPYVIDDLTRPIGNIGDRVHHQVDLARGRGGVRREERVRGTRDAAQTQAGHGA